MLFSCLICDNCGISVSMSNNTTNNKTIADITCVLHQIEKHNHMNTKRVEYDTYYIICSSKGYGSDTLFDFLGSQHNTSGTKTDCYRLYNKEEISKYVMICDIDKVIAKYNDCTMFEKDGIFIFWYQSK